ncbi:unnamed protein product [Larinioides sclopetarius]
MNRVGIILNPLCLKVWRWIIQFFSNNEEFKKGMNFPKRHDLACYDREFDFKGSGFCPQQWEISVRQNHCIIWSVVLSYLKSANSGITGQFENRLNRLTGVQVDSKLAKDAIENFNPFFNIHKCFYSDTLQEVCRIFRNRVKGNQRQREVSQALQTISSMLNIKILIVDLKDKKLSVIEPEDNSSLNLDRITLIFKEHATEINGKPTTLKRFNFGLDDDLCCQLRKKALEILLESPIIKIKADEEIIPMLDRGEKDINFVITLLKKEVDRESSVSSLYESWYVAGKLSDAGFETDPRALDPDGFSAFYYALQSSDDSLVYTLYRYAANSCYETESTFRDSNPSIISNLSKLKETLNGDCVRSRNFEQLGDKAEHARSTYRDLVTFNEYLTRVTCGMNDIRKRYEGRRFGDWLRIAWDFCCNPWLNFANYSKEAAKQKEIISLILNSYDAFFSVGPLDSQRELIANYTKHKTYYDNLDFAVALLFFDNIFQLKSILESPKSLYSKLESSFLLSVLTNKSFTSDEKNRKKLQDLGFELDSIDLSIIPLLERLYLRENVKDFCKNLRQMRLVQKDKKEKNNEFLSDFPELTDEFLISRLERYIETALDTTSNAMKQKFVIQRALQVIGESIKIEELPSHVRHLFRKCVTESTLEDLKVTRNTLSHLKSYEFPFKFETEKDDKLFASIQDEIRKVKKAFDKVFDIQRIRLMKFLISRGLESVQKFQQESGFDMNPLVPRMKTFVEKLQKSIAELECILDQKGRDESCVVTNINYFRRILMGYASERVKKEICVEIPKEVINRVNENNKLSQELETLSYLSILPNLYFNQKDDTTIDLDRFNSLFLKKKDLDYIKKEYRKCLKSEAEPSERSKIWSLLHRIQKSPNPLNTLDLIFEKKKVSDSQLKVLLEAIPFSDKSKSRLKPLIEISKGTCGNNLANLLNRIEHLHRISIDEQYDIRFLWERVKSSKAKQYLVYKIVQRYFREPSFQASMEILLFDCIEILRNYKPFKRFLLKDSYLFNGIDVRNVLAHGDPLLESIGDILDPKDLPSELVKKMLQLFDDRECIEALCDLWQKAKQSGETLNISSQ